MRYYIDDEGRLVIADPFHGEFYFLDIDDLDGFIAELNDVRNDISETLYDEQFSE